MVSYEASASKKPSGGFEVEAKKVDTLFKASLKIMEEEKKLEKIKVQFSIKDSIKFGFGFEIGLFILQMVFVVIVALILGSLLGGMFGGGSPYGY